MSHQKLTSKFPTAEGLSYIHAGVNSGNRRRNSHIFERARNDLYVERPWCSERLFAVEQFSEPIWDPCEGTGTIPCTARAAGFKCVGSDLSTGHDFLTAPALVRRPFSICTNPPYSLAREIVERALDLGATRRPWPRRVPKTGRLARYASHWSSRFSTFDRCLFCSFPVGIGRAVSMQPSPGRQSFVSPVEHQPAEIDPPPTNFLRSRRRHARPRCEQIQAGERQRREPAPGRIHPRDGEEGSLIQSPKSCPP